MQLLVSVAVIATTISVKDSKKFAGALFSSLSCKKERHFSEEFET